MDWSKIKHFKPEEFKCRCCGAEAMDQDLVETLDDVRELTGIPMNITSGYRCHKYDFKFGGKGNHDTGKAADIECRSSAERAQLLTAFVQVFQRIGIAKTFIHVDMCEGDKPQGVFWLY